MFLLSLLMMSGFVSGQEVVMPRLGDWVADSVEIRGSVQGMAIQGRYAVSLRNGGQCLILDMRQRECVAAFQLEGDTTHCNNASFGKFFSSDRRDGTTSKGMFPLLYVSACFGDKVCNVTEIGLEGSRIVQKIFYDSPSFPVAQDWCVDATENMLYAFGGKRGGMMYLKQFALPNPDLAEVHLNDDDVLRTIPITCVKVAQGSRICDGYAYLPDGDSPGCYWLHIIDLSTGAEVFTIDLNDIGHEPEGLDIQGRWLYVSFHTADARENKIVRYNLNKIHRKICKKRSFR